MIISAAESDFTVTLSMRHTTPVAFHVLSVAGELDLSSAPVLSHAVRAATAETGPRLILDVRRLTFCDASGLSVLSVTAADCRRQGGWLALACPSPMLVRLLTLVGLTGRLPLHPTLGEAVRAHQVAGGPRSS